MARVQRDGRNEQARAEIEELRGEMVENGQTFPLEAENEEELDWEISQLLAAMQSTTGCCFNATI